MAHPRVSVLLAVHNGVERVGAAVESILCQTFCDLELLIADDGSTDGTPALLQRLARRDGRIRLLPNRANLGLTKTLNRLIAEAHGELIARLDHDDVALPDRLRRQVAYLDAHPQVGVLATLVQAVDPHGTHIVGWPEVEDDHEGLRARLLFENPIHHPTVLLRAALLQEGGYDERLRLAQDYELWWRLSGRTRLAVLGQKLVRYLSDGTNIGTRERGEQRDTVLRISLSAVRDSLVDPARLDEEAYRRFWRAREEGDRVEESDVERLRPLWELLAAWPAAARVHGAPLLQLGVDLARYSATAPATGRASTNKSPK